MKQKRRKRVNGTGSIVKLSGNRSRPYRVLAPGKRVDGRIEQITIGYTKTYIEAEKLLATTTRGYTEDISDWYNITVEDLYAIYIDSRKKVKQNQKPLSDSQLGGYKSGFKRLQPFHKRSLRSLHIDELQDLIDELIEDNWSKSLVDNVRMTISQLYKFGIPRGAASENISTYLQVRMKADTPTPRFSREEIEILWDNKNLPGVDMILSMIYTMTRPTELCESKVEKYNRESNILVTGIKTDAGIDRAIPIHRDIKPFLLDRIGQRKEGNIFVQDNGLPIDRHHFYKHIFSPIREKLKLSPDLVPRSCRKTGSSLMAEAKIPDVFRKKIIGHEDIHTTNKYYTELDYKNLNDAINMI